MLMKTSSSLDSGPSNAAAIAALAFAAALRLVRDDPSGGARGMLSDNECACACEVRSASCSGQPPPLGGGRGRGRIRHGWARALLRYLEIPTEGRRFPPTSSSTTSS